MKIFEGKSPAERNKTIAAVVLGTMALIAAVYNIRSMYSSSKSAVTVTTSSPTPAASSRQILETVSMPNKEEENLQYTIVPVVYSPNSFYAPDAGRNIFAFYEPPPPTPYVAPPIVYVPPTPLPTPTPTPVPPLLVGYVTPQSVYAGSKTFRLEVNGDKFTPDSLIFLNESQIPTNFISPQKLTADIPSNLLANAGSLQIIVRTSGGLYSNPAMINVQPQPQPQETLQYIGLVAKKRSNNDTAYFLEKGKEIPISRRLNDVVGGRFRIVSISAKEVVLEDVSLGFPHRLPLFRPPPGQSASGNNPVTNNQNFENYSPYNPGTYTPPQGEIPGIPSNIPRYVPPQPQPPPPPQTKQRPARPVTDDDDDDGDN